jgi:hypothetical protein
MQGYGVGKLQRYFWPKTALLFCPDGDAIDAAFGFVEKEDVDIVERRTIDRGDKTSLAEWYREIVRTYPKTYAAAMLDTINQGALPGCGKSVFAAFGVEAALVQSLCVDDTWEVYASLVEMKWFEQKFREIELDLVYSPFVLLYSHSQPFLEENPGLFLLHQEGVAYMMVLSKEKMWYAQTLIVSKEPEEAEETLSEAEMEEEEIEGLAFDLEEISADTEVEPISDVDVLTDFKDEIGKKETGPVSETALELLEYNLDLFENLKEAVSRFYHDDRYPHEFIEKVTIFDTASLEEDLVRYIEDELFMEASLHRLDPIDAAAKLVAREIGS